MTSANVAQSTPVTYPEESHLMRVATVSASTLTTKNDAWQTQS